MSKYSPFIKNAGEYSLYAFTKQIDILSFFGRGIGQRHAAGGAAGDRRGIYSPIGRRGRQSTQTPGRFLRSIYFIDFRIKA